MTLSVVFGQDGRLRAVGGRTVKGRAGFRAQMAELRSVLGGEE